MNLSTIIAKVLGAILLLLWLVFIPAGRICLRQMGNLLFWEPTNNLNEKLKLWLEQTGNFQKITVSIIHKAIIRTWASLSAGRDSLYQEGMTRCEVDNFQNRIMYAMNIIIFRWHILPFIVGVGLILSGSLWPLLVLPIAWILSIMPFFPFSTVGLLIAIVSGWIYGGLIFSYFSSTSNLWYYISRIMGVSFMFLVWLIIFVIFLFPYLRYLYGYGKYKSSLSEHRS